MERAPRQVKSKDPAISDINNIAPYMDKLEKHKQSRSPYSTKQQQYMLFEVWRLRKETNEYIQMTDMANILNVSITTLRSIIRRAGLVYSKPTDHMVATEEITERRRKQFYKTLALKKENAKKRLLRDGTEERQEWINITKIIAGAA